MIEFEIYYPEHVETEEGEETEGSYTGVSVDTTVISDEKNNSTIIKNQGVLFNDELSTMLTNQKLEAEEDTQSHLSQLFQNNHEFEMEIVAVFTASKSIPETKLRLEEVDYTLWVVFLVASIVVILGFIMKHLFKLEEE